jgi:hypothetical protein
MVGQAIQHGGCHFGVPEHLMMPLILSGESLMFRLLILITHFLGTACGWGSGFPIVGRRWLWWFFPMGGNDLFGVLQRI